MIQTYALTLYTRVEPLVVFLKDPTAPRPAVVHLRKTKRGAVERRFPSMLGKMQITLQDFRDFRGADSCEEDKTVKKKKKMGERGGFRPMVSARRARYHGTTVHTHCGHAGSLLFHAAKYRVLFTRCCQPRWKFAGPRDNGPVTSSILHGGELYSICNCVIVIARLGQKSLIRFDSI